MTGQEILRRAELIQVAAVAVANLEIITYGQSNAARRAGDGDASWDQTNQAERIMDEVYEERLRQDRLWGIQSGGPVERMAILMEEVGEVAEEIDPEDFDDARLLMWTVHAGNYARAWLGRHGAS